jgi:hypothetical protein
VPQLRRLSITGESAQILVLILFNDLRQCSFTLNNVHFENLEQFMKKYSHQIKLVHSCTMYSNAIEIWNKLMSSYLPLVKIVDFKDAEEIPCDHALEMYKSLIPSYFSVRGNIQQSSFTHEPMSDEYLHTTFFSFEPHR